VTSVSAKVVLAGEGNAGKSSLALRLAEDRYEELPSTHGMRVWTIPIERFDPSAERTPEERREVVVWDLGGQDEYRLVHQLFIHDTTLALLLAEPRRDTSLSELEGWVLRFEKQIDPQQEVRKLLVATKVDDDAAPAQHAPFDSFAKQNRFAGHYVTSAKTDRGIGELRTAVTTLIDWERLTKTTQPELFQAIRDEIQKQIDDDRKLVIPYDDLEAWFKKRDPERFDADSLRSVVAQLTLQGFIADVRLGDGTRMLILRIEHVSRYAGSLICAAKEKFESDGVPSLEISEVLSTRMSFPRMPDKERLRRDQELVVLDAVVQLLIERGIAIEHLGLLVFPSLFPSSQGDDDLQSEGAVSLFYDFSGAIDNIYASLVTAAAHSRGFGKMRLGGTRAAFTSAREGTCGEPFVESTVRKLFARGEREIGCQLCATKTKLLTAGAEEAKTRDKDLEPKLLALKSAEKKHAHEVSP
jgi:GTPase SAR1 family protein